MQVIFENCTSEIEDEMSTELVLCAGVKVEDITCFTRDSINFHQFVTNILPKSKKKSTINAAKHAFVL